MMDIKMLLKQTVRRNSLLEAFAYLLQNNLLSGLMNFSGDGDFKRDPTAVDSRCEAIASRFVSLYPGSLAGKTVLEIGTGRSTLTAYHMSRLSGANRVITYDAFRQVWDDIDRAVIDKGFTGIRNVSYIVGRDALEGLSVPVDYVFSNAVLEHIWDLDSLLEVLSRICSEKAVMIHQVDLKNHKKFDAKGPLYFHRFSDALWSLMANKVGHPNRFLAGDYRRIFLAHGFSFDVLEEKRFPDEIVSEALETYLKGRVPDSRREELACSGMLSISERIDEEKGLMD